MNMLLHLFVSLARKLYNELRIFTEEKKHVSNRYGVLSDEITVQEILIHSSVAVEIHRYLPYVTRNLIKRRTEKKCANFL